MIIFLDRSDLTTQGLGVSEKDLVCTDFRIASEDINRAALIVYQSISYEKVLKNRYGNTGEVIESIDSFSLSRSNLSHYYDLRKPVEKSRLNSRYDLLKKKI